MKQKLYEKPTLTFEQQLNQLVDRGLVVQNENEVLKNLAQIGYYRLSAYWYPFRLHQGATVLDRFKPDTTFEKIMCLYHFDKKLRLLVTDAIESIEVMLRTKITYYFSHRYGPTAYINASYFHTKFLHTKWLEKVEEEIQRSKEAFVKHYKEKYTNFPNLPMWMSIELISLGSLSRFYQGMKIEDQRDIAQKLSMHHKNLVNWLHLLTYIRNICAHHSRLWNRDLIIKQKKKYSFDPSIPNNKLFYVLLVLQKLLIHTHASNHTDWKKQCEDLICPISATPQYQMAMGIPNNWTMHPLWNNKAGHIQVRRSETHKKQKETNKNIMASIE